MNARALTAFACAIAALASLGSVPAAAGERLDNIVKNNTLRVGTPGDYRPFAMKEDSGYAGHDIDVVKAMAEVYGWKVEFVPTTWKQMAADLKDNRFDVAVGGITRSPARALTADFLPAYAPFGKVALVNVKMKNKFRTLDDLNQPDVRVIKNPGGTNEAFVLANLTRAKVSTHDKNFEIPGLIAEGRGDVMITENAEAKLYAKKDKRLHAAFLAAAPAVNRVDHHGAAVVDDIGVTGKAHDAELLVGHIVGRQQHRIGVAAADARHQESVKLLLAAGGQAWDLHLYLLTLLVDDGGVPGGGSGEGHLRRGAHEAEHNRPRHDDGRHHRQGNIQPQQNLLLFGARPAGLFLPLGLFFPPGTLRLLYPGAAPVVLSLFRVHQSLVPFVLLRSQSRAFTVLGCTGRPRSAISCMLISHPRSTAASRSS